MVLTKDVIDYNVLGVDQLRGSLARYTDRAVYNASMRCLSAAVANSTHQADDVYKSLGRTGLVDMSWRGGLVVGRRTWDLGVAGSRPGRDAAAQQP